MSVGRTFREDAKERGLLVDFPMIRQPTQRHFFDINSGSFYSVDSTPAKVRELVELARRYGERDYGVHNAMLALVTYRHDLVRFENGEINTLIWNRSYHVISEGPIDEKKFITLRTYLQECGEEPNLEDAQK